MRRDLEGTLQIAQQGNTYSTRTLEQSTHALKQSTHVLEQRTHALKKETGNKKSLPILIQTPSVKADFIAKSCFNWGKMDSSAGKRILDPSLHYGLVTPGEK